MRSDFGEGVVMLSLSVWTAVGCSSSLSQDPGPSQRDAAPGADTGPSDGGSAADGGGTEDAGPRGACPASEWVWDYEQITEARQAMWGLSAAVDDRESVHIGFRYIDPEPYESVIAYVTNASGAWTEREVERAAGSTTSLGVDDSGVVHVAYQGTGFALRYATIDGDSISIEDAATAHDERFSLVVEPDGTSHLSYYRCIDFFDCTTTGTIFHATNASGGWEEETVVTTARFDQYSMPGYAIRGLAVDGAGNVDLLAAFRHVPVDFEDREWSELVVFENAGGAWDRTVVSDLTVYPYRAAIAVAALGTPSVAFVESSTTRLAVSQQEGDAWESTAVDVVGETSNPFGDIAVDAWGDTHVAYSTALPALRYATTSCGAWEVVDLGDGDAPSLAVTQRGAPVVAFTRGDELWVARATR